ncbi:MAG TPA: dihydroorotate dehydrogenase-like protein [Vicinamibacteria bacterium]
MDLSTTYLGLKLPHPFMPGASPLADDLDTVKRLEDAGAAAIVMRSLFEEQIVREEIDTFIHTDLHGESFAEALCYFPSPDRFAMGPEEYLEQITRIKATVRVPVIASLNGTTRGGWLRYARLVEQAGADALELNVYSLASDLEQTGQGLEEETVEMVRTVKRDVRIPVAVKLSPFYTSLAHFCRGLEDARADGLVLFNRLLQPDIEPEDMVVSRHLHLSNRSELPLRLRWLALLSGRVRPSLAVSGGVHDARDAVKAVMAGAHAVQLVSALVQRGVGHLKRVRSEFMAWMAEHEYHSLDQLRGSMNFTACPDPEVYERANYMLMLQGGRRR